MAKKELTVSVKGYVSKAEMTEKELDRFMNSQSMQLSRDLIYGVYDQYVHVSDLARPIGKYTTAKRIFIIGFDNGNPVDIKEISCNGVRQLHYGDLETVGMHEAENRDGVLRIPTSVRAQSLFTGGIPQWDKDGNSLIVKKFAFRVKDRNKKAVANYVERGDGKWDVETVNQDGKQYVKFSALDLNEYEMCEFPTTLSAKEIVPSNIVDSFI